MSEVAWWPEPSCMVASDIGAEQSEIDECIDDDDETVSKLIKLIFKTDSGFLFWEHSPKQQKKKQKVGHDTLLRTLAKNMR